MHDNALQILDVRLPPGPRRKDKNIMTQPYKSPGQFVRDFARTTTDGWEFIVCN